MRLDLSGPLSRKKTKRKTHEEKVPSEEAALRPEFWEMRPPSCDMEERLSGAGEVSKWSWPSSLHSTTRRIFSRRHGGCAVVLKMCRTRLNSAAYL